jgi:hypothetical protein
LYAGGFSLVEFLLSLETPARLLEFQRDPASIETRLTRHYQLTPKTLGESWIAWRTAARRSGCRCEQCGCPLHRGHAGGEAGGEELTVWTAAWCEPCRRFKADDAGDVAFRAALRAKYRVHLRDVDAEPQAAAQAQIEQLPTFVFPGGRLTGYAGPEDLLRRLGLNPSLQDDPAATPLSEQVGPAPVVAQPPAPQTRSEGNASAPAPRKGGGLWLRMIPITLSLLQWTGIIGGTVATGGVGGLAVAGALWLIRRRVQARGASGGNASAAAPFPRKLDEAGQLLGLAQSEGRVATLDALRGMFLDDELEKLEQTGDAAARQLIAKLRTAIDARVDEVAPLTTSG